MGHEAFTWASYIPFLKTLPPHVSNAIIVSIILLILVLLGYKQVKKMGDNIIPDEKFTLRNFVELLVEGINGFVRENMGENGPKFMLIIGTLAIFILFNNLSGLIPGFLPATDNVNTTFACSLTVFVLTHFYGLKEHGLKYLRQFVFISDMMPWYANVILSILMCPIELISHIARPMSLGIRLFGNITGDHLVTAIFFGLVPILIPVIFMFLGLFVAFVQTFVFTLLSMVYFAGAVSHEGH